MAVWPTCMIKSFKKREKAVESYVSDIRSNARFNVAQRISEQHRCSLERAMDIIDCCEYRPLIEEEMVRLHKGGK